MTFLDDLFLDNIVSTSLLIYFLTLFHPGAIRLAAFTVFILGRDGWNEIFARRLGGDAASRIIPLQDVSAKKTEIGARQLGDCAEKTVCLATMLPC